MDWLKSFFRNAEFSGQGSLIRLANPADNYTKKTEFMNSTLIVKNKELFVKNDEFDPDQDQIEYVSFPLNAESQLVHYTIVDDETRIECVKWVNLNFKGSSDVYYGFEFESANVYSQFASFASKYTKIDEEGCQDPGLRLKNLKKAQNTFAVTSNVVPSNIKRTQLKPDVIEEEEKHAKSDLNFKRVALAELGHLYSPESVLFVSSADLYLLGPNLDAPILADKSIAFLIIRHPEFRISLDIVREQQIVMRILIDTQFYCQVDPAKNHISWVELVSATERRMWRANLSEDASSLESIVNVAKYESEKKVLVSDLSQEDQKWVRGEAEEDSQSEIVESEMMELDFEENKELREEENEEISDSVLSWADSKVIASRKGKVSIYCDTGSGLQKTSAMDVDADPTGLILKKQATNLLFLDPRFPNMVYILDLARNQVVDQFKIKEQPILQLANPTKFAALTDNSVFMGLCEKALYTLDPRDSKKIVQEFSYTTNPKLSCMSTTDQGHIAVGSAEGTIRLYKEIGKKATTNFPGLGHPIISIDTSKDGSWLLATTETYLMVIQTKLDGELAYTKALSRKRKPAKKLMISPADIGKYQIMNVAFTPARFNISESNEETAIITSTGNFIVIWNFASVKSGNLLDYYIKPMDDSIIKNEFKFGEENVIVTHPKSVEVQNSRWNLRRT